MRSVLPTLHFYPRSPCGERHDTISDAQELQYISIHALLAESDPDQQADWWTGDSISIHALLAESDFRSPIWQSCIRISIHALLAESDHRPFLSGHPVPFISIHALLAESDPTSAMTSTTAPNFYPRSPCGERLIKSSYWSASPNFYPRSPCGERPTTFPKLCTNMRISIHALLAESDFSTALPGAIHRIFLSTLSLRRATCIRGAWHWHLLYFYPRSPCGERRDSFTAHIRKRYFYPRSPCGERRYAGLRHAPDYPISIHALLAESDMVTDYMSAFGIISIHALLAESDSRRDGADSAGSNFYPRSPCGERPFSSALRLAYRSFLSTLSLRRATALPSTLAARLRISIHALLAESDNWRLAVKRYRLNISIHALLAESDLLLCGCSEADKAFLSTLSLRRATVAGKHNLIAVYLFLSTLSLRRATKILRSNPQTNSYFYPRSPCGERHGVKLCIYG